MQLSHISGKILMLAALASVVATACGNGDSTAPTPTPGAQATPTTVPSPTAPPTSTGAAVTGLVVLNRNVSAASTDALGTPPQQWNGSVDAGSFDRSLAAADWSIDGTLHGVTGPDGRFSVATLAPGPHTLEVAKTLGGNLASVSVPFTVGDDGRADLVIEVAWGQVKSAVTYTRAGVPVREVRAPNGNWLTVRDGHITGFGDSVRTFADPTGSGTFMQTPCGYNTGQPPPDGYACNADGTCAQPGDRCVCIASCPGCDDCPKSVCVPSCPPVEIAAIAVTGTSQLILGQQGFITATAQLSDGGTLDVTYLVDWAVNDPSIASIDSWGTVTAVQVGSTSITAAFGDLISTPWPLQVTARPPLQAITLQNVACLFPMGGPMAGGALPANAAPPPSTDILPAPSCNAVVEIGATIQFRAIGQFGDSDYEDITGEVQWQVVPPEVASVVNGLFTGEQAGTASITASLAGVVSSATQVRVVTQPTVVGLTIYADTGGFPVMGNGVATGGTAPAPVASGMPCVMAGPAGGPGTTPCCCPGPLADGGPCRCAYSITVLSGDQLQFHATAQYDTGAWKDVTADVIWSSSQPSVAGIAVGGVMTAMQAGDTDITATLDTISSDPASVHVVDHATLQSIWMYEEGQDRVVAKGDQRFFHAIGSYDVGISREITTQAIWRSSDESVGGFDTPGVFTGRAAGMVQVWAELDGQLSNQLSLEVFETSELSYCDPNNINRAVWSDDFNRVTLESDCAWYSQPGVAALRYTVTEIQPHGGVFDPCLDLYVFQGTTPVRTIRNQGCGDPFLAANAPGRDQEAVQYQLRAFWDLKDDSGNAVPPGAYTIYGRFYLYYDPVISLGVNVLAPDQPTPTPGPPPPTATPGAVPTIPLCCEPGVGIACPPGVICPLPTPGGCGLACDGRPCLSSCPDGTTATGTCTSLTIDRGCECVPGCTAGVPTATPAAGAFVSADAVSGQPGTSVTFNVTLHSGAVPVAGVQNDIAFDVANAPIAARPDGKPDCTGLVPNKLALFSFPGCAGGTCSVVRAIVYAPDNTDVIPDGTTLYSCRVAISPSATPGVYPLKLSNLVASDPLGNRLPLSAVSGQVTVLGAGTPTPTAAGECFVGPPDCTGSGFTTSQQACCDLSRYGAMPGVVSWCPAADVDSTGACSACGDPCAGLPTPTPVPTIPLCCEPGAGIPCPVAIICPPPTPGGCGLTCDGSPCLGTCPDGSIAKGTCGALTIDRGCECAPECAPATPGTPPPTPTAASFISLDEVSAQPGTSVTFSATLHTVSAPITGVQNDITFDPINAPIAARPDGKPDCTGFVSNKLALFSFPAGGCAAGACTVVRALVYAPDNTDLIPDGTVLYTCTVAISPAATAGVYPLDLSNLFASDPIGNPLALFGVSGQVTVLTAGGASTPTPVR